MCVVVQKEDGYSRMWRNWDSCERSFPHLGASCSGSSSIDQVLGYIHEIVVTSDLNAKDTASTCVLATE